MLATASPIVRRYTRPTNAAWAALAVPLFVLAVIVLSQDVVGPYAWDGRAYEPHPWRATAEFFPAALGFIAFAIGVGRERRAPFLWAWATSTALWVAILGLEPV